MKKLTLLLAGCSALLALSGCASMDGLGAKFLASDISLVETAQFVEDVAAADLDMADAEDREIIYRAVDTWADKERGKISEEEASAEVDELIKDMVVGGADRD